MTFIQLPDDSPHWNLRVARPILFIGQTHLIAIVAGMLGGNYVSLQKNPGSA
jgi:hypothetical protein